MKTLENLQEEGLQIVLAEFMKRFPEGPTLHEAFLLGMISALAARVVMLESSPTPKALA